MNKLFIIVALLATLSCNRNFDHTRVYEIIRGKFPNDLFIEKSLEKAQEVSEPIVYPESLYFPDLSFFDLDFDPLEFLLEKPLLELHHIYEIQWADKLIAQRLKGKKIYKKKVN